MKVLIVDDSELMRYTIRALLIELGHDIVGEAGDGAAAVKAYVALKPDVVFLDLILPGRSGVEVLADIRKLDPKARVVIITAVQQQELDRQLSHAGVAVIIRKPFSYEEFKTAVRSIVL